MNLRHAVSAVAVAASLLAGAPALAAPGSKALDAVAVDFVRMTLEAGEREAGYVDAYYGPEDWAQAAKANPRPVSVLRQEADRLQAALGQIAHKDLAPDERPPKLFL